MHVNVSMFYHILVNRVVQLKAQTALLRRVLDLLDDKSHNKLNSILTCQHAADLL